MYDYNGWKKLYREKNLGGQIQGLGISSTNIFLAEQEQLHAGLS